MARKYLTKHLATGTRDESPENRKRIIERYNIIATYFKKHSAAHGIENEKVLTGIFEQLPSIGISTESPLTTTIFNALNRVKFQNKRGGQTH